MRLKRLVLIAAGAAVLTSSSCAPSIKALNPEVMGYLEERLGIGSEVKDLLGADLYYTGLVKEDTFNELMYLLNDYCNVNFHQSFFEEGVLSGLDSPGTRLEFIAGLVGRSRKPLQEEKPILYDDLKLFFDRVRVVNGELKTDDSAQYTQYIHRPGYGFDKFRTMVGRVICLFGPPDIIKPSANIDGNWLYLGYEGANAPNKIILVDKVGTDDYSLYYVDNQFYLPYLLQN